VTKEKGLLKLALACLLSWSILLGLFADSTAQNLGIADGFLILGTVVNIEHANPSGGVLITINDGVEIWTIHMNEMPSWLSIGDFVSITANSEGNTPEAINLQRL